MSRLRTYAPMQRRSEKVTKAAPDFRAVYKVVDQRSEGRCEVNLLSNFGFIATRESMTQEFTMTRCRRRASDHHHLYKPRRSHHDPALIVHLCRHHHERCEWPYKRGRLVVSLVGGRHTFALRFAADKFAARVVTACLLSLLLVTPVFAEPHLVKDEPHFFTGDWRFPQATTLTFQGEDVKPFLIIHLDTKTIEWTGDQSDAIKKFWTLVEKTWPICAEPKATAP